VCVTICLYEYVAAILLLCIVFSLRFALHFYSIF